MSLHDIPKKMRSKKSNSRKQQTISRESALVDMTEEQAATQLFIYANFYGDFTRFITFADKFMDNKADYAQRQGALEPLKIVYQSLRRYEGLSAKDSLIPCCMGILRSKYASIFAELSKPRER